MSQAAKIGVAAVAVAVLAGLGMVALLGESDDGLALASPPAEAGSEPGPASTPAVTFDETTVGGNNAPAALPAAGLPPTPTPETSQASAGSGVTVNVLNPDGGPATAAQVVFLASGSKTSHAWTPAKTLVSLAPGLYTVRADADGALRSERVVLTVRAGEGPTLTLQLLGRTGLIGRVEAAPSEAGDRLFVWTLRLEGALDVHTLQMKGERKRAEKDGTFRLLDLRPGTYGVGAGRTKGLVETSTTVVVDRGRLARADLVLPSLDASRVLIVRVLGPDGELLADATAFGDYKPVKGKGKKARAVRKDDGTLWLVPEQGFLDVLSGAVAGEAFVRVSHTQHGEQTIPLSPGSSLSLTVRFEGAAALVVEISGYQGSDVEGDLRLELVRLDAGGGAFGTEKRQGGKRKVDPSGKETFGPIQPGDYELRVLVKENGKDRLTSTTQLQLRPGENTFSLPAPQLSTLTVLTNAGGSLGLHRIGGGSESRRKQKPENGKVVFARLVPGQYQLVRWSDDGASFMTVHVNGATQVSFAGSVANSLLVQVSDSRGSLAAAGLRSGDRIVGLDGTEFTSTEHMQKLIRAASSGAHKLTVQRGGARLELSVNDLGDVINAKRLSSLKRLLKPRKKQGGWFEVASTSR